MGLFRSVMKLTKSNIECNSVCMLCWQNAHGMWLSFFQSPWPAKSPSLIPFILWIIIVDNRPSFHYIYVWRRSSPLPTLSLSSIEHVLFVLDSKDYTCLFLSFLLFFCPILLCPIFVRPIYIAALFLWFLMEKLYPSLSHGPYVLNHLITIVFMSVLLLLYLCPSYYYRLVFFFPFFSSSNSEFFFSLFSFRTFFARFLCRRWCPALPITMTINI